MKKATTIFGFFLLFSFAGLFCKPVIEELWTEFGSDLDKFNLAGKFSAGKGVPKNNAKALKWYRKAAEMGNPSFQLDLGIIYYYGSLASLPNMIEAEKWFEKAAKQGNEKAQVFLGYIHLEKFVRDFDLAYMWLHKAACNGNARAQFHLGTLFEKSNDFSTKGGLAEAFFWYSLASSKDSLYSRSRDQAEKKLDSEQIAEVQARFRDWHPNSH